MTLTLDSATQARIQRQLECGSYSAASDLINRALDALDAQNDWLLENKEAIDAALDETFVSLERGEGYSPEESRALLAENRAAG